MFWHIFTNRIKCMVRDKTMMFWTLLFPLVLATFFSMAFANLSSDEVFKAIPIAVVDNDAYRSDLQLQQVLKSVSTEESSAAQSGTDQEGTSDFHLFVIRTVDKKEADRMLEKSEISGYLEINGGYQLFVKKSGMDQTIMKSFFDQYLQTVKSGAGIFAMNPQAVREEVYKFLSSQNSYFQEETSQAVSPDMILIYFYSLLAMTCFYGGFMGMKEINAIQADQSSQAARLNVAPTSKMKAFLASMAAASLVQFLSILLVLVYMAFVLKVEFGSQIAYILLLCASGCITGVSYGVMLGTLLKGKEGVKTGILIGSTMVLSFLAGMMQAQVKYLVTSAVPALAYLNPMNVITDAFYALYYYQTHTRFFINIAVLWVFTILFAVITINRLRRLKYAGI